MFILFQKLRVYKGDETEKQTPFLSLFKKYLKLLTMIKLKFIFLLFFVWFVTVTVFSSDIKKQNLKLLYVGNASNKPLPDYAVTNRNDSSYRLRMGQFEAMLKTYFTDVAVIDGRDYTEAMTTKYDVVIFDALPKPIIPPGTGNDYYNAPKSGVYFSENYDCPTIIIGEITNEIGKRAGLKLKQYCLCLYDHALNIRTEHPIFNTPYSVNLTMEERSTPDAFYGYADNWLLPRTIPMWRVSADGGKIGVVSGWNNMEEGNDAEIISGGTNSKSYKSAAIARHGNFFLWGFGTTPQMMTDEAKTVFANAVCYISQFRGQKPVVKAFNYPTLRSSIDYMKYVVSPQGYQDYKTGITILNRYLEENQKKLKEKESRGELLSADEQRLMNRKSGTARSRIEYVYDNSILSFIYEFDNNIDSVYNYIDENMDYFWCGGEAGSELQVDEEMKALKLSNREVKSLDVLIRMMEREEAGEKAMLLLKRYTNQTFENTKDWRKWYNEYKDKLFFTDLGNYKFMGDGSQCIDYVSTLPPRKEKELPVKCDLQVKKDKEGNYYLDMSMEIQQGYHVYASTEKECPFTMTNVKFILPDGVPVIAEMELPKSTMYDESYGLRVYKGAISFRQKIKLEPTKLRRKAYCEVEYQCCTKEFCLSPVQVKLDCLILYYP